MGNIVQSPSLVPQATGLKICHLQSPSRRYFWYTMPDMICQPLSKTKSRQSACECAILRRSHAWREARIYRGSLRSVSRQRALISDYGASFDGDCARTVTRDNADALAYRWVDASAAIQGLVGATLAPIRQLPGNVLECRSIRQGDAPY